MKKAILFSTILVLTGCDSRKEPQKVDVPTVEELAAAPARLKELRQTCKLERSKVGDELCNRVAEATRRRFYGDGQVPYTPQKESPKF